MHRVYSNPDPAMAHLVRHALDAEGIPAVVRGDRLGPAVGEVPWVEAWAEVWVGDPSRLDEARAVVAAVMAGPPSGAPWRCGGCGEEVEAAFGACWSCGAERPA
jgi:hypothetical protein